MLFRSGRLEDAHQLAERARVRFKRLDDRFGLGQALAPLVRSQIALGRTTAAQRTVEELISLSTGSRQGVFPIGAAAGAAMHRGNGAVAVQLAERALTELEHTGGMVFEPTVMLCIACLQVGDIERAETAIADLPDFGRDQPFAAAAAALLATLAHRPEQAIEIGRAHV